MKNQMLIFLFSFLLPLTLPAQNDDWWVLEGEVYMELTKDTIIKQPFSIYANYTEFYTITGPDTSIQCVSSTNPYFIRLENEDYITVFRTLEGEVEKIFWYKGLKVLYFNRKFNKSNISYHNRKKQNHVRSTQNR